MCPLKTTKLLSRSVVPMVRRGYGRTVTRAVVHRSLLYQAGLTRTRMRGAIPPLRHFCLGAFSKTFVDAGPRASVPLQDSRQIGGARRGASGRGFATQAAARHIHWCVHHWSLDYETATIRRKRDESAALARSKCRRVRQQLFRQRIEVATRSFNNSVPERWYSIPRRTHCTSCSRIVISLRVWATGGMEPAHPTAPLSGW
jgi:hypothetical protein